MKRYALALGLATATLGCGVAHAPDGLASSDPGGQASSSSCPAVAASCPAGCFAVGAHPVDRAHKCLLPRQAFSCSPFDLVGPPAVACSVAPDETIWISFEARRHPLGRFCSSSELDALNYSRCP
ncbi:MAG TPA: hypothetical protein VFQ51_16980 [Vicinamibacteria bacterium]|nr:hypothetical protein [Vicinamibacteria bacterium]